MGDEKKPHPKDGGRPTEPTIKYNEDRMGGKRGRGIAHEQDGKIRQEIMREI